METKTKTTIDITLTEDEAKWLRELVQNPIGVRYPQDEPERDKIMRKTFWEALSFSGV